MYKVSIDDWTQYGKYYRQISNENSQTSSEYGYTTKGTPIKYGDQTLWKYYTYYDKNENDFFSTDWNKTLSYINDRSFTFINYWQKTQDNKLNVEIGLKDKFFCIDQSGEIVSSDFYNSLDINVDGKQVFHKDEIRESFENTDFFDFSIDLNDYQGDINITTKIYNSDYQTNLVRDEIDTGFTIDPKINNKCNIDLTSNDQYEIVEPIMGGQDDENEIIEFRRIAKKEYLYPENIIDLFSIKYMNKSNLPGFMNMSKNMKANIYLDGEKYEINIKNRDQGDIKIFYFDDKSYFDLRSRKVVYNGHSNYNNFKKGFTLNWDKHSTEIIYINFNIDALNDYDIDLSIDISNKNPLIGEEGKWKIQ